MISFLYPYLVRQEEKTEQQIGRTGRTFVSDITAILDLLPLINNAVKPRNYK